MAQPKVLRQDTPSVKCGRNHAWSGVVVAAGGPEATEAAATQKAVDAARGAAEAAPDGPYTEDKGKKCPDTCPSTGSSLAAPQTKDDLRFAVQDPATLKWTGYGAVFWTVKRTCSGTGQPEAFNLPAAATVFVTTPDDVTTPVPACGARIQCSGAVIARAFDGQRNQAERAALDAAKTEADRLFGSFRQKRCPNACPLGVGQGAVRTPVKITSVQVLQAVGSPYVAYAAAFFDASLECPLAAGGGRGGGGG